MKIRRNHYNSTALRGLFFALALVGIAVWAAFVTTGCSTVGSPSLTPEQGAAFMRVTVSAGATLALAKNPRYAPAAQALADGIAGALSKDSEVSSASLANWVRSVCQAHEIPPADVPAFIALVQTAHSLFAATYGESIVSTADPRVKLYAMAFGDGLRDALAAIKQ